MKTLLVTLLFAITAQSQTITNKQIIDDALYLQISGGLLDPQTIKNAIKQTLENSHFPPINSGETKIARVFIENLNPENRSVIRSSAALVALTASQGLYKGEGDKQKHIIAGGIIMGGTSAASKLFYSEKMSAAEAHRWSQITGILANITVAAAKEIYDGRNPNKHTQDINDFAATVLGAGMYFGMFSWEF